MCGCIEDMPEVSRADCSVPNDDKEGDFEACTDNDLRTRFKEVFPDDDVLLTNLVEACDNEGSSSAVSSTTDSETYSDVADFNFDSCDYNTYMCCWTENNNQGMEDNTVRFDCLAFGVHLLSLLGALLGLKLTLDEKPTLYMTRRYHAFSPCDSGAFCVMSAPAGRLPRRRHALPRR